MSIKASYLKLLFISMFGISTVCSAQEVPSPSVYNDGLQRTTPEEQGVPSATIAGFFEKIREKGYDVHGLMIIRHGKVITEHWWAPYAPQYQHAMYSATKTFTGTAVGFAVSEGLLNIEDKVISLFPGSLFLILFHHQLARTFSQTFINHVCWSWLQHQTPGSGEKPGSFISC